MNAFKEWWSVAPARDQLALIFCALAVALYILFVVVLRPVQNLRSSEEIKNAALRNSLENVRTLAAKVVAKNQVSATTSEKSSLEKIVQQTVAVNGLQVASMNASGATGVRLRFDDVNFEKILQWLYEMEVNHQLQIKDLSVAAGSRPGTVTVNLRLHQD